MNYLPSEVRTNIYLLFYFRDTEDIVFVKVDYTNGNEVQVVNKHVFFCIKSEDNHVECLKRREFLIQLDDA